MAAGRVTSFLRRFVGMVILADFTDLIDMNEKFEFKIQHDRRFYCLLILFAPEEFWIYVGRQTVG